MRRLKKVFWRDIVLRDSLLLNPGQTAKKTSLEDKFPKHLLEEIQFTSLGGVFFGNSLVALPSTNLESLQAHTDTEHLEFTEHGFQIKNIVCRNHSRQHALIPTGTVFSGGAQNRLLPQSTIVKPGVNVLPTFCVEQGRWEKKESFTELTNLPDLVQYHFLKGTETEDVEERQIHLWQLIREMLALTGKENDTMNAAVWSHEELPEVDTKSARGTFQIDQETGLTTLQILPHEGFMKKAMEHLGRESSFRRLLRQNAGGAREYFRIFDEKKQLGILCKSDGQSLHNMFGQPLLVEYKERDLENSFQPPLETPPAPVPLSLGGADQFTSPEEMVEALTECTQTRLSENSFHLTHPHLPVVGEGLLLEGQIAALKAIAFQPLEL